jgi:hypothetical protein
VDPAATDARLFGAPAINEAKNLAVVLPRLPVIIDEVALVDGDSKDDTVAVTRTHPPNVRVVGQDRPGKGDAPRAGFAAAQGEITGHQGPLSHRQRAELRARPDLQEVTHAHLP